jgi:hypothetical protein
MKHFIIVYDTVYCGEGVPYDIKDQQMEFDASDSVHAINQLLDFYRTLDEKVTVIQHLMTDMTGTINRMIAEQFPN